MNEYDKAPDRLSPREAAPLISQFANIILGLVTIRGDFLLIS